MAMDDRVGERVKVAGLRRRRWWDWMERERVRDILWRKCGGGEEEDTSVTCLCFR